VVFRFKSGEVHRCPFGLSYYQRGGWRLEHVATGTCVEEASPKDSPPALAEVENLSRETVRKFFDKKGKFPGASIENLRLKWLGFKHFQEGGSVAHYYGGEFDVGNQHCSYCYADVCQSQMALIRINRGENETSDWTVEVDTWPPCSQKPGR
jgi:hypothetical protein